MLCGLLCGCGDVNVWLQDDRLLLFSQFTMMLDVVEEFLKQKNIKYLRLDGSTPVTDRSAFQFYFSFFFYRDSSVCVCKFCN
jgi:hypothetical protein